MASDSEICVRPAKAAAMMGGIGEATLRRLFDQFPEIAGRAFIRPGAKTLLIRVDALRELSVALAAASRSQPEPAGLRAGRQAFHAKRDIAASWCGSNPNEAP